MEKICFTPDNLDEQIVSDGITVRILAGSGMTMSIPLQLMRVERIEIVK